MNSGPHGTPPEDAPPPEAPQPPSQTPETPPAAESGGAPPEQAPPSWLATPPQAPPPEPPSAGSEPGYPEPGYSQPPAYAAAPPPRRSMVPIIAGVVIVVVLIAAIGAYVVGGYAYATTRLNSATSSYNTVVDHLNSLNDTVNGLGDKLTNTNAASASAADLQTDKGLIAQIVTKSQAAQGQIDNDDTSLAQAQSNLQEGQWLTVVRKGDIDKAQTRIGHERKALALAKTITADYVQIGTFYQTFFDVAIDVDTLGTKAQAADITGASAADEKLKTDTAKAITEDKAPGLPPEMDTFLQDIAALAKDFSALVNAKDSSTESAAETALQGDVQKIQNFDFNKIGTAVHDYYQPLIDSFNSEVDKANKS